MSKVGSQIRSSKARLWADSERSANNPLRRTCELNSAFEKKFREENTNWPPTSRMRAGHIDVIEQPE